MTFCELTCTLIQLRSTAVALSFSLTCPCHLTAGYIAHYKSRWSPHPHSSSAPKTFGALNHGLSPCHLCTCQSSLWSSTRDLLAFGTEKKFLSSRHPSSFCSPEVTCIDARNPSLAFLGRWCWSSASRKFHPQSTAFMSIILWAPCTCKILKGG